ncbi:MAG: hypothetical protein R2684_11415 [Pyrinomonadaceae bacterium]
MSQATDFYVCPESHAGRIGKGETIVIGNQDPPQTLVLRILGKLGSEGLIGSLTINCNASPGHLLIGHGGFTIANLFWFRNLQNRFSILPTPSGSVQLQQPSIYLTPIEVAQGASGTDFMRRLVQFADVPARAGSRLRGDMAVIVRPGGSTHHQSLVGGDPTWSIEEEESRRF